MTTDTTTDQDQYARTPDINAHEFWRLQDSQSSAKSSVEQLEDQLRQNRKGMFGAFLKAGLGSPLQAIVSSVPQKFQRHLQSTIAVTQMAAGIVGAFNTLAEGMHAQAKLTDKRDSLESTTAQLDTISNNGGPGQGTP